MVSRGRCAGKARRPRAAARECLLGLSAVVEVGWVSVRRRWRGLRGERLQRLEAHLQL